MITRLMWVSLLLAVALLALGHAWNGAWTGMLIILAAGALWWVGQRLKWGWTASAGLVVFAGAAANGFYTPNGPAWALPSLIAALSAWDLAHFNRRLSAGLAETRKLERAALERRHLGRLLLVDGLGLTLAVAALMVRVRLDFGLACVTGLIGIMGMSQIVRYLRRESE